METQVDSWFRHERWGQPGPSSPPLAASKLLWGLREEVEEQRL